jgi:two-component SAPR family response regulator
MNALTPPDGKDLNGLHVLIVEDQYVIASELVQIVVRGGGIVEGPYGRVQHALDAITVLKPDIAILDINLHGKAGYEVARVLLDLGVPFVFVTGYSAVNLPSDYRDIPLLEKPVQPQVLVRLLRQLGESGAA